MAAVKVLFTTPGIFDSLDYPSGGKWDGYACTTGVQFLEGTFQGYFKDWGGYDSQGTNSPFANQQYSGYNTNWGGELTSGLNDIFHNTPYVGYNTNWGKVENEPLVVPASLKDIDLDSVVDYPKEQTIYYKLRGWNPLTSTYESWVISENITGRPSLDGGLFDPNPGSSPPNIERDVFKTPPSGNTLTNIVLVSRWIE